MTQIIDGRRLAADMHIALRTNIAGLGFSPTLVVIIVGEDPASMIYVRNKTITAERVGVRSEVIRLPATISEPDLLTVIAQLNADDQVDGLMVQLPLPPQIRPQPVIDAIDPEKDVDGFHPLNIGRMTAGGRRNVPCTPKGVMRLLEATGTALGGARALVVGSSAIVGRPVSTLLSQAGATVTVANKSTRDLAAETARAEIVVVAAGCPGLIRGEAIKPGAVIIDVGINRLADGHICGDVAYNECLGVAGAITPVPGGVGPMTIACLLENTVEAAIARRVTLQA